MMRQWQQQQHQRWWRLILLMVIINSIVLSSFSLLAVADGDFLECAIGWGSKSGEMHKISQEQINDGYCDCPLDGADEPHTNACSGSMIGSFTGISAVSHESRKYQCPQQRKLEIPYSRFQDGICDCCDGSDELPTVCPDICDQVLAKERALREKMEREFTTGQALRNKEIQEFQNILKEKENEKKQIDEQLETVNEQLVEIESELDNIKYEFMQERVTRVDDIAKRVASGEQSNDNESIITGLLEPLTNDEISNLIVHSCQLAGEMDRASLLDDSTCVPLRLAGLDAALLWKTRNDDEGLFDVKRLHMNVREEGRVLADLLIHNAREQEDRNKWFAEGGNHRSNKHRKKNKKRNKPGRRRLQEVSDDEEYPDDYIDEYDDYMYDEEMQDSDEEGEEEEDSHNADNNADSNNDEPESVEKGIMENLKESLFSQPRVAFLSRSREIIDGIDELLKEENDDDKEKKEDESEETSSSQEKKQVDPAAYKMVQSTLEDREDAIQRGYDYAVSAKMLLSALQESSQDQERLRQELLTLAVGTLVYGKISSVHIWQIFQTILPEFNQAVEDSSSNEKTCATSPWASSCPPRSVVRNSISFPPEKILSKAQVLCTTPTFTQEKAQACAADADNQLPIVMPDGYYGYEVVQPRDENDPLEKVAAEWDPPIDEAILKKLEETESSKKNLEGERKNIEDSAKEISELVEGAKESRYGIDGELYALKDKCFSVVAGKYTYEGCIFGSAAQKEGDAKSGTGLGQWEGSSYDEETGNRIFKWTNGVKCWNGPKRSATAIVTCGAETKVLSADEPDTCRYILEMESHVACDDTFKTINEL